MCVWWNGPGPGMRRGARCSIRQTSAPREAPTALLFLASCFPVPREAGLAGRQEQVRDEDVDVGSRACGASCAVEPPAQEREPGAHTWLRTRRQRLRNAEPQMRCAALPAPARPPAPGQAGACPWGASRPHSSSPCSQHPGLAVPELWLAMGHVLAIRWLLLPRLG